MEMFPFLAQFFGILLLVLGVSLFARRELLFEELAHLYKHPMALYMIGLVEFALGLLVVFLHNVWVFDWPILVTILGWGLIIEGLAYLFLPSKILKMCVQSVNHRMVYILMGGGMSIFGLILLGQGLGVM